MESIYYVMAWACHRRCRHCYEDRFRPYVRDDLARVVAEARENAPRIVDAFPERMTFADPADTDAGGRPREKVGRIILSGGEALLDAVREDVTYPTIARIVARYRHAGGVKVIVQTTGDLVTDAIVDELLAHGAWMISVAGMDDFHVGMEGEAKQRALKEKLARLFEAHGMRHADEAPRDRARTGEAGPVYHFFGATPESWIGKLWPRGRAWTNGLSTATLADNFCNRWSGGLNFLNHGRAGAEVSVEPNGDVYPCCVKTRLPIGNLLDDRMTDILDSLAGDPVYQAINEGAPERMGLAAGWSVEDFIARSETVTPDGRPYRNLCIGCDRFHDEVLAPRIAAAAARRRDRRAALTEAT